jgi:hypothetical protein
MAFRTLLKKIPAGYAAQSARPGEDLLVQTAGYFTSEDGLAFIRLLEGLPSDWAALLPPNQRNPVSQIDHLLGILGPDRTLSLYINELTITAAVQSRGPKAAGEPVMEDEIRDLLTINLGVDIPETHGVVHVFSKGWRKAMFFDLRPLSKDGGKRDYDIDRQLGACYSYLWFQSRLTFDEADWTHLFTEGWFPFSGLGDSLLSQMANYVRDRWPLDELLPAIVNETAQIGRNMVGQQEGMSLLQPHLDVLNTALARFEAKDYLSTVHLLYPRIEGLLRSHFAQHRTLRATQDRLIDSAILAGSSARNDYSLLMPTRFQRYLKDVVFADFDPVSAAGVSRNTIGHGVVDPSACDAKAAAVGFLVLDQLSTLLAPAHAAVQGSN